MSCKCKNIIENFQGGTIPLDTSFLGNVNICGSGRVLRVSNIIGCSPVTIGSDSGCTSATTTVLIVSGKTNFGCDINLVNGADIIFKYSGFTNNINTEPLTTNRNINFPDNDGVVALLSDVTGDVIVWTSGSTGNFSVKQITDTTTDATGNYAVAEGLNTTASGEASHTEGRNTTAIGDNSHAEGRFTTSSGNYSHTEGYFTTSIGDNSHAEGNTTTASGLNSHAEGNATIASGFASHSEGASTEASGAWSHAGGFNSESSGTLSFIHSANSLVSGDRSVVLGGQNITGSTNDTVYVPNLNIVNIISANDDTDAGLSGLTTGDVYQTSGVGASPLNVPGILMIKQ